MPSRSASKGSVVAVQVAKSRNNSSSTQPTVPSDQFQTADEKARDLLELVKARIETRKGYYRLVGLSAFFGIYVTTLIFQQRVQESFLIESR